MSRFAKSPSLVSSSSPVVAASSRPIGKRRGAPSGMYRPTVGRPCGSSRVVTTPAGLLSIRYHRRSGGSTRGPSTRTSSMPATILRPGVCSSSPFTPTRPARIISSAARRDATPARARYFWSRSGSPTGTSGLLLNSVDFGDIVTFVLVLEVVLVFFIDVQDTALECVQSLTDRPLGVGIRGELGQGRELGEILEPETFEKSTRRAVQDRVADVAVSADLSHEALLDQRRDD